MKKIVYFLLSFFSFVCIFVFASCHSKKKTTATPPVTAVEQKRDFEQEGYIRATVIYYEVDACSYLLQLPDGKKLEPTNLAAEFRKDQLPVWVKYMFKKNAVSACMAGQIVELADIQMRK